MSTNGVMLPRNIITESFVLSKTKFLQGVQYNDIFEGMRRLPDLHMRLSRRSGHVPLNPAAVSHSNQNQLQVQGHLTDFASICPCALMLVTCHAL